jgi:hypothetical protein
VEPKILALWWNLTLFEITQSEHTLYFYANIIVCIFKNLSVLVRKIYLNSPVSVNQFLKVDVKLQKVVFNTVRNLRNSCPLKKLHRIHPVKCLSFTGNTSVLNLKECHMKFFTGTKTFNKHVKITGRS